MKLFLLLVVILDLQAKTCEELDNDSLWVWPKTHQLVQTSPSKKFYILQSSYSKKFHQFNRLGIFPHAIYNKNIFIVMRLYELPPINSLISNYLMIKKSWELNQVKVKGLQLDFDSTTSNLKAYSTYLKKLKKNLDTDEQVSITGLADWVNGDKNFQKELKKLDITLFYQFYQGKKFHKNMKQYLRKANDTLNNYYLGFLNNQIVPNDLIVKNKNFKGFICFYTQ